MRKFAWLRASIARLGIAVRKVLVVTALVLVTWTRKDRKYSLTYYYFCSLLSYPLFKSLAYYSAVLTRVGSNYNISFKVFASPLALAIIDL